MGVDHLESLSNDYERTEANFMTAVRRQSGRVTLAVDAEAYRKLRVEHSPSPCASR